MFCDCLSEREIYTLEVLFIIEWQKTFASTHNKHDSFVQSLGNFSNIAGKLNFMKFPMFFWDQFVSLVTMVFEKLILKKI